LAGVGDDEGVVGAGGFDDVGERGLVAGGRLDEAEGHGAGVRGDGFGEEVGWGGVDVGGHGPGVDVAGELDVGYEHA
jgi:hypothetical protein